MFNRLFTAGTIANIEVKNRLIMAPMGNNYGVDGEVVAQRQLSYYERHASGGVGLIITESCPVDTRGVHGKNRIQVYLPDAAEKLNKLVETVHRHGCRIILQLTHGGAKCSPEVIGEYPVAPSSLFLHRRDYVPRTLTITEIEQIVERFANAARTAHAAGFDGVQILAASGHLVNQFLSPVFNRRSDRHGGSLENRMRFLREIIQRIKAETENVFPVLVKIYGKDPENPERTRVSEDEICSIASYLDSIGVASLHFSTNYAPEPYIEQQQLLALTAKVKQRVAAKLAVAGSIHDPARGEEILRDQKADFIELGRALLCDPDFANKARAGELGTIRPCLGCNRCRYETSSKQPIRCTANPWLGRESDPTEPAVKMDELNSSRVAIIGAGPAGLQAAISLSERGYSGIIHERGSRPGGLLWSASAAPGKERMGLFVEYLVNKLDKTNFEIKLNTDVTLETFDASVLDSADMIIVASGAVPYIPKWVQRHTKNVHMAVDLLVEKRALRGDVFVLGAGQVGCEVADFLSEGGDASVTLMSSSAVIAKNVIRFERTSLLKRLAEKGVKIVIHASPLEYDGSTLRYRHREEEKQVSCDAAVIAKGWIADSKLRDQLEKKYGKKVITIGDASEPRSMLEALEEGLDAAAMIAASDNRRS